MAKAESLIDQACVDDKCLKIYFNDAEKQLLAHRQDLKKNPALKPRKFFKDYFTSVHQGTHVLFREFSFVNATSYNRLCFLNAIMQVYKPLLYKDDKYSARDYHSILQLLTPDFDIQVVQDAFNVYQDGKKDEENCLNFFDFIKALKACFCTGTFDYETNLLKTELEAKIEEFSSAPSQSGETSMNLCDMDNFFHNDEDLMRRCEKACANASMHLKNYAFHGSELERASCSYNPSRDDSISREKSLNSTSELQDQSTCESYAIRHKDTLKSAKSKNKKKKKLKGKPPKIVCDRTQKEDTKAKLGGAPRGRLPKKCLSTSLSVLQRRKSEDAGGAKTKIKLRQRSKSASSTRRSFSETVKTGSTKPRWRV